MRVANTTSPTIPNLTPSPLSFDTVLFDGPPPSFFAPDSFLAPEAGLYQVTASVVWTATVHTGQRVLSIINFSGASVATTSVPVTAAGATTEQTVTTLLRLVAGELVRVQVFQGSGFPLTLDVADDSQQFMMVKVGN